MTSRVCYNCLKVARQHEFTASPNRPAIPDYSCYGSTRIDAIGLWVIDYGCGSAVKVDEISGEDGGFKIYGEGLGIGECGGKEQDG